MLRRGRGRHQPTPAPSLGNWIAGEEGETTSKDENSKKRKELWQAMEVSAVARLSQPPADAIYRWALCPLMGSQALQKQGVVKHLGVSNFTQSHLEEVLEYCQSKPLGKSL